MRRRARLAAPSAYPVLIGPAPPSRPPVRASLSILALSPSRSPFQNPGRAPELPSSPTRSAGVKLPHCHPISRFSPPAAPPWTPASLALTRGCRRQGEGRAWPPPFSPARTLPRSRGPPRRRAIPPFPSVRLSVVSTGWRSSSPAFGSLTRGPQGPATVAGGNSGCTALSAPSVCARLDFRFKRKRFLENAFKGF